MEYQKNHIKIDLALGWHLKLIFYNSVMAVHIYIHSISIHTRTRNIYERGSDLDPFARALCRYFSLLSHYLRLRFRLHFLAEFLKQNTAHVDRYNAVVMMAAAAKMRSRTGRCHDNQAQAVEPACDVNDMQLHVMRCAGSSSVSTSTASCLNSTMALTKSAESPQGGFSGNRTYLICVPETINKPILIIAVVVVGLNHNETDAQLNRVGAPLNINTFS